MGPRGAIRGLVPMDRHVAIEVLTPFRLLHLGFLLPAVTDRNQSDSAMRFVTSSERAAATGTKVFSKGSRGRFGMIWEKFHLSRFNEQTAEGHLWTRQPHQARSGLNSQHAGHAPFSFHLLLLCHRDSSCPAMKSIRGQPKRSLQARTKYLSSGSHPGSQTAG